MIYAMKFVRYFMVIELCLYGSSATAMLKLKLPPKPSSQDSVPLNVISLPRTNFIANLLSVPSAMGTYIRTIDLSACRTFVIEGAVNNPEFTVVCITNFIANLLSVPSAMGTYIRTIDLSACRTFVIEGAVNNPEFTVVCITAC